MDDLLIAKSNRRLPTTLRGQRTRQKLLAAAEELFGIKGFENTSIYELTHRAGIAPGTFYIYFPDKKSIFIELMKEYSHLLRTEMTNAVMSRAHGRGETERVALGIFFNFIYQRPNLFRIVRQAEFVDYEQYQKHIERFLARYIGGLSQRQEKG